MKLAMHQPDYLPWLGLFRKIARSDTFVVLDKVQLRARGYTNRVKIKGPEGPKWLTQPIKGIRHRQDIKDVEFVNLDWVQDHLKMLQHDYGKAKYYSEAFLFLEHCYNLIKTNFLFEANTTLLKTLCEKLDIATPFIYQTALHTVRHKNELVAEICYNLGASKYLSGHGAKVYLKLIEGVDIEYNDINFLQYPQLWGDFVPGLSIIDVLFNCGFEATKKNINGTV